MKCTFCGKEISESGYTVTVERNEWERITTLMDNVPYCSKECIREQFQNRMPECEEKAIKAVVVDTFKEFGTQCGWCRKWFKRGEIYHTVKISRLPTEETISLAACCNLKCVTEFCKNLSEQDPQAVKEIEFKLFPVKRGTLTHLDVWASPNNNIITLLNKMFTEYQATCFACGQATDDYSIIAKIDLGEEMVMASIICGNCMKPIKHWF
jgi:hypothetical protein